MLLCRWLQKLLSSQFPQLQAMHRLGITTGVETNESGGGRSGSRHVTYLCFNW